jgi:nucleoside-specific outer membrane channel protein Tsx
MRRASLVCLCVLILPACSGGGPGYKSGGATIRATPSLTATLTASDAVSGDDFGTIVALSGTTALVGAEGRNAGYVFTESGGTWTQRAKLTASDGTSDDGFGASVALSGTTALIGADGVNSATGAAYVFTESGGTWTQRAKLTASDGAPDDAFGHSVALSGTTALITAPAKNSYAGTVYLFTESGGAWTQQAKLIPPDGIGGFGVSVAISGNTAFVGAHGERLKAGAVYVFTESGGTWTQRAKLTPSDGATDDDFGDSVALSGTTALISAPGKNSGIGAAYVFTGSGGTWTQRTKLTASDGSTGDGFGALVALSGAIALTGVPLKRSGTDGPPEGAAYVFTGSGGTWTQRAKLIPPDGIGGFGISVALSGITGLVGAYSGSGAVYVFSI